MSATCTYKIYYYDWDLGLQQCLTKRMHQFDKITNKNTFQSSSTDLCKNCSNWRRLGGRLFLRQSMCPGGETSSVEALSSNLRVSAKTCSSSNIGPMLATLSESELSPSSPLVTLTTLDWGTHH